MAKQTEVRVLEKPVTEEEYQEILERIPLLLRRIELTADDMKRKQKEYKELLARLEAELAMNRGAWETKVWRREVQCEWRGDLLIDPDTDEVIDTREYD